MKAPLSHPTLLSEELLLRSCDIQRTRGSGPGGQHRNKVETAIVITHQPTGVTGQASERRSQHKNREVAIQRLRLNLALQVRTAVTADDPPSELWQSRVRSRKINVSSSTLTLPHYWPKRSIASLQWNSTYPRRQSTCRFQRRNWSNSSKSNRPQCKW